MNKNQPSGPLAVPVASGRESSRSQADELHIENERLKTTLTILTQKLKVIEDDNLHASEQL